MACMAKQFAQSQDPNLSCPGVAPTQPPLVSNEIAYNSHNPNASCLMHPMLHLISSHFIHIGSSIFLCSLAICPSLSFIGYLKPSNQDNLPHSIIETIQYRYPPSPHRAYSIYKCLQEQTVVSSNRREEYKKLWWNCYSYTGSYNEINNLDYL